MPPFTLWILNLTIWALTGAGFYFGLRSRWRQRRARREDSAGETDQR